MSFMTNFLFSVGVTYIKAPSQVTRTVQLNPRIDMNPKFRYEQVILSARFGYFF